MKKILYLIGGVIMFILLLPKKLGTGFTRSKMFVGTASGGIQKYCTINKIQTGFLNVLNKINREYEEKYNIDLSTRINSAFRCLEYNRLIGSMDTSTHIKGGAVDLGITKKEALNFIPIAKKYNIKRFIYHNDHLHVDNDPDKKAVELI